MMRPLQNIKVLDLSHALAGPYCTMILSDFGAEVVKIEMPGQGDEARQWGPPFIHGESAYFLSVNRGKKSVTLNLREKSAKEIFNKLAEKSDIIVENFRPGVVDRLGINYAEIRKINPKIIYSSISGFGQDGPYKEKPAYDLILQGMGGLMSITGYPDMPPVRIGVAISDILAGMFACHGILLALIAREKTGEGQYIDISLLDSDIAILTYMAGNFFATGQAPQRLGSAHPNIAPYQTFRTKDMHINVAAANDGLWQKFALAIGGEHLLKDPRFATNPDRVRNRKELVEEIEKIFASREGSRWLRLIEEAGVPCGPVYTLNQLFSDPQTIHRNMIVEIGHPKGDLIKLIGLPIKLSETPGGIGIPPPVLGQHNDEILTELGFSKQQIDAFRKNNVI